MNVRTHCLTGLAAGAGLSLYYHQDWQGLVITSTLALVGAFVPDVPIAANLVIDKYLLRIDPFSRAKDGDGWFLIKDISHSPFIWLIGFLIAGSHYAGSIWSPIIMAFSVGFFSHWLLDIFSHGGAWYEKTDGTMLFPLSYLLPRTREGRLPKLPHWLRRHGLAWEYRSEEGHSIVVTKPPEKIFQHIVFLIWLGLILAR